MIKQDSKHYKNDIKKAVNKVISISKSGNTADIADLADIIISSYHDFGDDFLNVVKQKKVLLNYSSIDYVELIFETIFEKLDQTNSKIPSNKINNLKHFLIENYYLVVAKIRINNSFDSNVCWGRSCNQALKEIAAEIYEQVIYINNEILELDKDPSRLTTALNLGENIRLLHEYGTIAFKEALQRNLPKPITQVENCHWNEILNLADKMYLLHSIEDRYVYFDWNLISNPSNKFNMIVCRPKSFELENVLHFSAYRSNILDVAKYNLSSSNNEMNESDIAKKVIDSISVDKKINFKLLLQKMPPEVEAYIQAHMNSIRQIIEESHLTIIQKTPEFKTELFPIINAWKCLFRLCFLRKLAIDELLKENSLCHGLLMFTLTKQEICQYFQEFGNLNIESTNFALNMLIFKPDTDEVRTYDPYKQPLILLDNNNILLLETYIQNSRILRNSLKLLTQKNKINLDKCGHPLEIHFQTILQSNQFKTNDGKKVEIFDSTKKSKTDLDVLAYRDGVLFLGQVKNVLPPGNLYEISRLLDVLKHAGNQLQVCKDNLDYNMERFKDLLGMKKDEELKIDEVVTCILTNDITFGGYGIDDFIVFDIEGFDEVLKSEEEGKSYREALMSEIESHKIFHQNTYENQMIYYEVKLGDTIFLHPGRVHIPVTDY